MSEAEFQAMVIELAELNGWMVYHTRDSRRSQPGFPDLVMVRAGRMIAAELKSETGKATGSQEAWLDLLGEVDGVEAWLWRPSHWDQICKLLSR